MKEEKELEVVDLNDENEEKIEQKFKKVKKPYNKSHKRAYTSHYDMMDDFIEHLSVKRTIFVFVVLALICSISYDMRTYKLLRMSMDSVAVINAKNEELQAELVKERKKNDDLSEHINDQKENVNRLMESLTKLEEQLNKIENNSIGIKISNNEGSTTSTKER